MADEPKTHDGRAPLAAPIRGADEARRVPSRDSATLPAASSSTPATPRDDSSPGARRYALVDALRDVYEDVVAAGPVEAIESAAGRRAKPGAMLLTDSTDGERGVVVAERRPDGWLVR